VTFLAAFLVLSLSAVMVLQFESTSSDANIETGGEALWWALVTLTTVGYGDFFPVTIGGRVTAAVVMVAGVGIIASLASILARVMIPADDDSTELAQMRDQLDRVYLELGRLRADLGGGHEDESGPEG
jgi:voltage-gated potassium channel